MMTAADNGFAVSASTRVKDGHSDGVSGCHHVMVNIMGLKNTERKSG